MKHQKKLRSRRKLKDRTPVDPCEHFEQFNPAIHKEAIVVGRVSTYPQFKAGNAADQVLSIEDVIDRTNCRVVGEVVHWHNGSLAETIEPLEAARKRHPNACVIFEAVDRAYRPKDFCTRENRDACLRQSDVSVLQAIYGEARLVTIQHPSAPWTSTHKEQTKRGKSAKGKAGGRPRNERRHRLQDREIAIKLYQSGMTNFAQIGRKVVRPRNTIREWINEAVRLGDIKPR